MFAHAEFNFKLICVPSARTAPLTVTALTSDLPNAIVFYPKVLENGRLWSRVAFVLAASQCFLDLCYLLTCIINFVFAHVKFSLKTKMQPWQTWIVLIRTRFKHFLLISQKHFHSNPNFLFLAAYPLNTEQSKCI